MSYFFADDRTSSYVDTTHDSGLSREERVTRLKQELRDHIRGFGDFKVLSIEWLKMTESLLQVANVATMEASVQTEMAFKLQKGKKQGGTLWDQEREELAVRILLEEGKLNLCLRIIVNFKEAQLDGSFQKICEQVGHSFQVDIGRIQERCRTFEKSIGTLLYLAFEHVEALQILDLQVLVQYCASVLSNAKSAIDKSQESFVIVYLTQLASKMEEIDEDRIMGLFLDHQIISLTCVHFSKFAFSAELWDHFVTFLNSVVCAEAFATDPISFVSAQSKKNLLSLRPSFENAWNLRKEKSSYRALVDYLTKAARDP